MLRKPFLLMIIAFSTTGLHPAQGPTEYLYRIRGTQRMPLVAAIESGLE